MDDRVIDQLNKHEKQATHINEIYTLFEDIEELIKSKESNNAEAKQEIELPDLSAITALSDKLDRTIEQVSKPI